MRGLPGSGPGGAAARAEDPRPEAVGAPRSVPQGSAECQERGFGKEVRPEPSEPRTGFCWKIWA